MLYSYSYTSYLNHFLCMNIERGMHMCFFNTLFTTLHAKTFWNTLCEEKQHFWMNMLLYMLIFYIIYCCSPFWQLAELRPWPDLVGFLVHKVAMGQVYLQVLWFSVWCHSTNASCSFIHLLQAVYNLGIWQHC